MAWESSLLRDRRGTFLGKTLHSGQNRLPWTYESAPARHRGRLLKALGTAMPRLEIPGGLDNFPDGEEGMEFRHATPRSVSTLESGGEAAKGRGQF